MRIFTFAAVVCFVLAAPASALNRSGTISEAKVYFNDTRDIDRLGALAGELDICTRGRDKDGDYLVINADAAQLTRLRQHGLAVEITWADIRDQFYADTGVDPADPDGGRDFGHFLTYWEMQDSLDVLAAAFPDICYKYSLGLTHQGRQIWCLKISDNPTEPEDEPGCFFNGAIHAREPMGTSCVMNFAVRILSGYGQDPVSTWLVDNREIFLVPVQNPDGYVYNSDSGGASSNWRKNRHVYQSPYVGVDLNRNYGYRWGCDNQGSSGNPSSSTYRGPSAFSEPATALIRDLMNANRIRTCMDYHTYGRYNMYPWGYARIDPPEKQLLQEMVDTFRMNNHYSQSGTGQISRVLYGCNGISADWEFADTAGKFVTYGFTCELSTSFWRGWDDSTHIRQECDLNIPNLYYLARVAGAYFDPVSVTINDTAAGNSSGRLDPGETSDIWFAIRNRAVHTLDSACHISAKLVSLDTLVSVPDSIRPFPDVRRLSSTDNGAGQFRIRAASEIAPGTHVPLRLDIAYVDAGDTFMMPVQFEVVIGSDPVGIAGPRPAPARSGLAVIPNPASGRVNFVTPRSGTRAGLVVFAADGSRVASVEIDGTWTWDCSTVPAGVYFARLRTRQGMITRRLSITH